MTRCLGYIRVSTAKQGEKGVSLQEQRAAIERFAAREGIDLVGWFEERQTAAKRGRPVFGKMLAQLRAGRADGVVIHKIDRSARNLRDWADLGELIDRGIAVHFVNESLDLATRGGRLSADIQAVVAADYIRNLREEARKGFLGRLNQGLYPLRAPLGYLDNGKGKVKTPDPERAPLVLRAFELYSSGQYGLRGLAKELVRLGLRKRNGARVLINDLSLILNNPFYTGTIRIKRTGQVFEGVHQPLVSRRLFERVQAVLQGKVQTQAVAHDFVFRRLLRCSECNRAPIGELQKGHVYYRCHSRECPVKCMREEVVESRFLDAVGPLRFSAKERAELEAALNYLDQHVAQFAECAARHCELELAKCSERLERLTDALLDGTVDRELYQERKLRILGDKQRLDGEVLALRTDPGAAVRRVRGCLELASNAPLSYRIATTAERRRLVATLTSNRTIGPSGAEFRLSDPFQAVADRNAVLDSAHSRDIPRTGRPLLPAWQAGHSFLLKRRETPVWVASVLGPLLDWAREQMGREEETGEEADDIEMVAA